MHPNLFQALRTNELEQYASELDKAVEEHARWFARINRVLICRLPPDSKETGETPHRLCHFGRWYHSIDNPHLTGVETFIRIGEIHEKMHLSAKRLLLKSGPIHINEYDELVALAGQLRNLANTLHDELRHNSNLVSKLMTKVFDNAKEAVLITAPDGTIINVNRAFSEVTGYSEEEAIGNTPKLLRSSIHGDDFYAKMWQGLRDYGQWQGDIWNRKKNGETYLERLSIAAVYDEQDELSHYVAIFADITSEKENEERLQYLAHYDQLTHLPNRVLFNDRMKQALAQAKREQRQVAIMFLDLDGFKEVNDRLGHNAGDEMLRQVAQRLENCLRATDTVARFGGDEFTIVLPEIDNRHSVIRIANKIGEEIARPYTLEGQEAHITTSIGISLYPDDSETPQKLLDYADNAMYHAKRNGKNHHEFYIGEK